MRVADAVITMGRGDALPVYPGKLTATGRTTQRKSLQEVRSPSETRSTPRVRGLLEELV